MLKSDKDANVDIHVNIIIKLSYMCGLLVSELCNVASVTGNLKNTIII